MNQCPSYPSLASSLQTSLLLHSLFMFAIFSSLFRINFKSMSRTKENLADFLSCERQKRLLIMKAGKLFDEFSIFFSIAGRCWMLEWTHCTATAQLSLEDRSQNRKAEFISSIIICSDERRSCLSLTMPFYVHYHWVRKMHIAMLRVGSGGEHSDSSSLFFDDAPFLHIPQNRCMM